MVRIDACISAIKKSYIGRLYLLMQSDAEDTLTRISRHPGVLAIMIVNLDGSFPRTMPRY